MQILTPAIHRLPVPPLQLGECPVWDAPANALWFADITAPALYRLDLASLGLKHWAMPAALGSFGLCRDGRLILALRTGVHFFDPASGQFTLIAHPEKDNPHTRLNDGKVGPDGRFWVGSMDERPQRDPIGHLFRVDHDGTCTAMLDGLKVSNGLAWSPDGKKLYHSDSRLQWVQTHDYEPASGAISNRRELCSLSEEQGRPDGAATDMEGFYWSAGVTAGCLNRIGPDGKIERKLHLPMAAPTMPCFGGPQMKTLFVTSLAKGGEAGTLVALEMDVPGVPVGRFGR